MTRLSFAERKAIETLRGIGDEFEDFCNAIGYIILNEKAILEMSKERHHLETNIFLHAIRVCYLSYKIAKILGLDISCIIRGGLLHDYGAGHKKYKHALVRFIMHGFSSAKLAEATFPGLISWKIKNVIEAHMFPATWMVPLSLEAVVVSILDKIVASIELDEKKSELLNGSRRLVINSV